MMVMVALSSAGERDAAPAASPPQREDPGIIVIIITTTTIIIIIIIISSSGGGGGQHGDEGPRRENTLRKCSRSRTVSGGKFLESVQAVVGSF
jgi:hypothetical protein